MKNMGRPLACIPRINEVIVLKMAGSLAQTTACFLSHFPILPFYFFFVSRHLATHPAEKTGILSGRPEDFLI